MSALSGPRWPPRLNPFLVLGLQALAFWPTWKWYGLRLGDSGEEAWGLAALLGAAVALFKGISPINRDKGNNSDKYHKCDNGSDGAIGWAPILVTCAYAAAFPFRPPLARAILALAALGCLLPSLGVKRRAALHGAGFLLLALPVMPSLQFYLGYPLRIAGGEIAARLINLAGFPVVRDGTLLSWRDHIVFIDAPCSGIKMLWAGMILALILSALRGLGPLGTATLGATAAGAVVIGNILRTTALFFLETGVVRGPAWAHSAIGVFAFFTAACLVVWAAQGQPSSREPAPCVT